MSAEKLWAAVVRGASAMREAVGPDGLSGACIHLGCSIPLDTLRELARLLGAKTKRIVCLGKDGTYVIESLPWGVYVDGVRIDGQCDDVVGPDDDVSNVHVPGVASHTDLREKSPGVASQPKSELFHALGAALRPEIAR